MSRSPTRRAVLATAAAAALAPRAGAEALAAYAPRPGAWRRFEITTRVTLPRLDKPAQVWVPIPALDAAGWAEAGPSRWSGNAGRVALTGDAGGRTGLVHAVWGAGASPVLEVVSEAAARDRAVDASVLQSVPPLDAAERAHHLAPTAMIPTDGIVRETADAITAGLAGDAAKARAIYDWIVAHASRDPETRGCGLGDVASMLAMGDLSGKCADLNALFVGLCRAAGLPARDVYGLRVAPSRFGYKSLGAGSADVTRAQHCRAEVHLAGLGWVPADPADVRKVMLEEPPRDLDAAHPKVVAAREALFGSWEGNWIALNDAHDVALPGAKGAALPFLMYPEAQVGGQWLDALDPDRFAYTITAREIAA